jgi:hypothetical protein
METVLAMEDQSSKARAKIRGVRQRAIDVLILIVGCTCTLTFHYNHCRLSALEMGFGVDHPNWRRFAG